ncbi:glucosylceramide transporter ABCA12 [Malaclemys terrapin pileata]|uniref:glucosylceramide transporter ABCA12 n=1 Tax=Malaclemys terrapin pileata TaxID=2991368 RepID=UPI0023A7B5C5|nr:glucosylceramide transporter ABCA12 [Malaclemys terrapin pileata]
MASLFQHLRILLWKNWLSVKRQPLWSFTLISWPLIVFIILAIVRIKFPPEPQPNCYLAPRNLPSAGFFPFLQTVLCDSDAKCKDTPYTPEDLLPRLPGKSPLRRKQKRSPNLGKTIHPSLQSAEVPKSRNASPALSDSTANLKSTLEDISSPFNLTSRINVLNKILSLGKAQTQDSSAANLKIVICEIMSPYITSSELPWESMGANVHRTFCFTNASLLESFFQAFRSQISQLQQDPQYQVTFVEETVSFLSLISRVQNDTSLWHFLLMAPDVVQGSLRMKDIFAFLQNTSSALMASQQVSPPVMSNDGIKTIHNRVLRLLSFLNCSEQGKNNSSTMADICNLFITWKDNQSSVSQMEEVWRKIKLPEFDGEDFRRAIFSKDLETVQKSLYLLKGFQQHLNRNKSENLNPFTESVGNETIQRLYEILKLGMNILYDYKLRKPLNKETIDEVYNFTSLLLQKDFNGTSIFNTAAHWKEIQSAFKLASVIWDLAFLNKTNFNTVKRWDIIKMKISHRISSFPEDIKNYLYAMQKIPSLYSDSLLKPTISEVFQEQLFTFQKIFAHVMNVNMMSRYYLLRNVFELMETIQNSTDEDLWKELDGDWRTVEKLRSAKWNNTDIIAYQQFLDILHNHLYTLNNGSDVLFNKELDQLIEFATCMLREYGGEASRVANISMTIEAIQKTLYILKDLQKKINISTLETIDLVFNFDNKNTGRLLEILRVGMKILYDNRLGEASDKEKIDAVYNFSHLLLQKEFNKTFLQHNTSLETKVLDLLHLVLSPFLVENNNRNEKPQNCSVQDILHIILQMLLKNITLSESLPGSHCKFLFTSMDIQTRTMENQTFTELFQLAIRNLEQTPEFASIFKNNNEYFSRELSCIIQSLQFSSSFLSNLNTVSNFKNLWIEEKYQTLTAISKELPQSNATCLIPGFQNMDSVFKSYPLNILIPIILNETDLKSQNFSGSSLDWNRLPLSTASLLPTAPQWNASIYELVQMVQNASNQPEWRRFSRVWKSIGNLMITKWNLTEVDSSVKLLEMLKKALNVVDIGLAHRKAKAHQFLHNSSLGMKPSNLEDIFSLLKLFLNSTSATNNKPDLERMFKRFASPNEIPAERLFYTNPYSEKIQRFLNLTRVIWYKLILNKELLSLQKLLATMAKVNITQHYLLISSLPKLMQRIQNSTDGAQWNDLNSYWHIAEILQSMKWSSTNVIAYKSLLDALQKHLRTVQNGSGLLFSNELEKLVKLASQEYGGEDAREANVSEYLQAVQRSIFIINNLQQKFNISELETINQWMNFDNNSTQRLLEIFRVGMKILSDARLGEASNIEKLDAVYNFSHLLLQKKFNKTSLQHNTSLEAKVLDLLYLALSPFLEEGNNDNKKLQNCSVHDIFYITLQMLFKNATLSESLPGSHCKFLFTSMDIQIRTTENKSFTELFQLAIRNLEQTPEFASIFKNNSEYFSRKLSCIIQSLQFSSSFLSDLNTVSHFKNPWIEGKYQTLTAISKELLQSNTTCLPPSFQSMTRVFNSHPLSSFIVFILNEMDMNSQNFSSSSVDWKNLFILFSDVQADVQRNSRVYELLQMVQSAPRLSEWNNFSRVWEAVDNLLNTKWNLTEAAGYVKLLEVMKRDLADSELASGILETAHYVLKKLNSSDLPSLLKMDLNPESAPNRANFDTVLDSVAHPFSVMAETLFNKTLTWNEGEQTLSPNSLVAQFLFLELENAILQVSADNIYKPYLICLMNVSGSQDNELTDNITLLLNHAQLKEAPFTQNDTSEKHASIPEILRLKTSHFRSMIKLLCDYKSFKSLQRICRLPIVSFEALCEQSQFHEQLLRSAELSNHLVTDVVNHNRVFRELRDVLIGDPTKIQSQMNWIQENVPQMDYFQDIPQYMAIMSSMMNTTENVTVSKKQEMLMAVFKNVDQLKEELRNEAGMSTASIKALMEMPLPENTTQLVSQILQLESCDVHSIDPKLDAVVKEFCHLSLPERTRQSYILGVIFLRHLDIYNFLYKMFFPKELQKSMDKMLGLLKEIEHFRNQVASGMRPLLEAINSFKKLRQSRNVPLSKALFKTTNITVTHGSFKSISKALCNEEITPLFFESLLPDFGDPKRPSSSTQDENVQKIMRKYGIPQDPTPFCLSFYLDLVSTSTGALIWSFLKPLLFGKILYTPDTPETRAIMEKSNATLKQMADLMQKSQEWLDKSPLIMNSLTTLNQTIPVVKDTLQNPFVQVFIKLMVKLDATELLSQINELDDIRLELQNNADIINQLNTLSTLAVNVSSCVSFDRIQVAKNREELEMVAKELFLKNELFGSVIFKLPSSSSRQRRATPSSLSLPPLVNYTIRMSSRISQTTNRIRERIWTVGPHNSASQSQIYSRAFIYIQDSIERAIIELQTGKSPEEIAVQVQATPYPCYNKDMFLSSVTYSLPFALMAAWSLFIAAFVKKLVQEKDLRLYEYMKMMGVNSSSHFIAWFIESATFLLITVTFLIIILKVGNILPKINVVILFLYLMDYSFSIIAMCYLISVFFNNTNIAALVGSLIYSLTFSPFIVLLVIENHLSFSVKSLLSLLSPTAFSYASQYIARYEEQGIGLQWDNMYSSPMTGDNTSFGWMCWLILIDSFIYFILGWYIRNVFPGKYGMAAPWYFPLLPSYWAERYGYIPLWNEKRCSLLFTKLLLRKEAAFTNKMYVKSALPPNLEPEPPNLTVGVSLHGITKTYGSKDAVENLSLNFYEENITSLLGHNGAGKTTTISILTGLFPASSGTIFVYGKDIRTNQDLIRKNMGVCMQHNVLFSYLTAKEHLLLYGYIKVPHWSEQELDEEVKRTLKDTGLYNHRHKLTGSLSGGMKRKLSIAIAFLGGSRVVILDEPTTGVDPCSRRSIWEIISKNKKGRTIILSTHHLDEAEVLSDRIAFLEHGGLKCCGSPFYLKETFGDGYHLTLTKKKCPNQTLTEEYDTSAVTSLIQSHLPEAYLKEDVGGELVYVLPPFNSRVSGAYQSLLRALDTGLSDLHIGCYGISDTTVEEVFLNLTKDLEKDKQHDPGLSQQVPGPSGLMDSKEMSLSTDSFTERDDQALVRSKRVTGLPLLLKKTTAVFIKRFHHTRRNLKGFFTQGILPVIFVTVAMGLSTLRTEVAEYPELHLSPSLYGSSGQADFFGNFNETTDALVASMLSFPGTDNTCLNESNSVCLNDSMLGQWVFHGNQSTRYSVCNCTDSSQTCPKIDFSPPHKRTFSSRMIYNLTGHDVETYLLATAKDFLQKRYGGWSFGLPLTTDLKFDIRPVPADRTLTKVWYNPEGYHSLPAYLNSLNNFILRANMPKNESSKYGISVVSHPYPGGQSKEQVMLSSLLDILVSMSVLIGYSITTASFVLYVVKEHQTKAKQLQHISGIGVTSYWVTNFIYDLVLFMVPVALSIGVISAFQIPAFFNDNNLVAVFLLMMMFGYATFSWMYLLAGIFKETGMAFIVYVSLNLSFSINTIITHSVVFLLSQEKATDQGLYDLSEILRHVFLISPQFCFGYGLIELSQHQALMGFLKAYGVDYPDRTFEMDRISSKLLGMFIQGTIFFAIRLLMHDGMIQKVWSSILEFLFDKVHGRPPRLLEAADEDKDVQAERERVESGQADVDMVQLQSLTKIYHLPLRRIMAVKNVSIGIPAGECFGLLGVNGAGKTTIFKMLTGDIGATSGRLRVRDQTGSLSDIDDTHWSLFGYCPQEDALDDLLTVEEHMYYYARLHGIPEKEIKGIVRQLLHRLNLMLYKDRVTSMCSYGTNRKLSTALALIGNPSILLLDEPSSGMDPNAKRHLWKIISEEVQNQCSVILTSHSMEECEALCTRLAIMVNGRFQCLGSLQHIKSRFGRGFTVKMHLMSSAVSTEALTELMQSHFPNTCLKDRHLNTVEYHVPISAGGVANIFDLLETNKIAFKIRHFSVSQTTLEEVFINFAKDQTGADNADASTDVGSDCSDTSSQDTNINAIC